jgi:hypothetical protein
MLRGKALEGAALAEYVRLYGVTLRQKPPTKTHPMYPFIKATADALGQMLDPVTGKKCKFLLEAKTVATFKEYDRDGREMWGRPDTDEVPPEYFWQAIHHLSCHKNQKLVVLFALEPRHWESRRYIIRRDKAIESAIKASDAMVADYWKRYIEPRRMGQKDAPIPSVKAQTNLGMAPAIPGSIADLSFMDIGELRDLVLGYDDLGKQIRKLEAKRELIKEQMLVMAGEHETVQHNGQTMFRARTQARRSVSQKLLTMWLQQQIGQGFQYPDEVYSKSSWRVIDIPKGVIKAMGGPPGRDEEDDREAV